MKVHRKLSLTHCTEAVKLDLSTFQLQKLEKQILADIWEQVCSDKSSSRSELVFVHGKTGSGKSSLVKSLNVTSHSSQAILATGRFDRMNKRPCSAVADAMSNVCEQILSTCSRQEREQIYEKIKTDLSTLQLFLPKLQDQLLNNEAPPRRRSLNDSLSNVGEAENNLNLNPRAFKRVKWYFQKLLRELTQRPIPVPIYFLIEDLQNADLPSLELFFSLASDEQSCRILFVGTYRDDDPIMDSQEFKSLLRGAQNKKNLTDIQINNISLFKVAELLSLSTQLPRSETMPLAEIIYKKTGGIFFFVQQFLELLQEQNLMLFSFRTNRWEWDVDMINAETDLADNMADILVDRIHLLPEEHQRILMYAATLGPQFDPEIVELILHVIKEKEEVDPHEHMLDSKTPFVMPTNVPSIASEIAYFRKTYFLETGSAGLTKFAHEKIQQVCYSLCPPGLERQRLHLRIGRLLFFLHNCSRFSEEWVFFGAVDQLNRGSQCIARTADKLELARMNMLAGDVAKSRSAFLIAADYLKAGTRLLDSVCAWEDHPVLALELYCNAAEMELCAGNADYCRAMITEILNHTDSLQDQLRAYLVLINLLGSQGQIEEAVLTGVSIMKSLGIAFPNKPRMFHVITDLMKTKRMLKGVTDDTLCEGTPLSALDNLFTLEVMQVTIIYAYVFAKDAYLPLILLRFMQFSLKSGISEYSGFAYANYAQILATAGEINEGYRFANLALRLLDNTKPFLRPSILYLVHSSLFHWKNPIRTSLDSILQGYSLGMETGNIEAAMSCSGVYCMLYAFSGLPLAHVNEDMKRFMQQMTEYNQDTALMAMSPVWQYVMNLMGKNKFPCVLTGEAMDQVELTKKATRLRNDAAIKHILRYRFFLAIQFNDFELAEVLMKEIELRHQKDEVKSTFGYAREVFSMAITMLARCQETRKKSHLRKGQKYVKKIEAWARLGNVNCHDIVLLLHAELLSLSDKVNSEDVRNAYNKAIASASRSGYIHNAAFANERAALFLKRIDDHYWMDHYLTQAHDLYHRWNAWGKVKQLERRHPSLRGTHSNSAMSTHSGSIQGRTRFDKRLSGKHAKMTFRRSSHSLGQYSLSSDECLSSVGSDDEFGCGSPRQDRRYSSDSVLSELWYEGK